jgi:F-type H+-transporting ATPase subunit epsilon
MATIPPLPTKIQLEIVTPERMLIRETVDEIQVPGSEGYLGILPGHTPLLSTLTVGELWYRVGSITTHLAVAGGFVEVLPDRVTILARVAERAEEIDVARAEAAKKRAEERLATGPRNDVDFERARIALLRSLIRLQVATRARTRA